MTDYSNTIIYMIHKPDSDLETYVGHTTNFDNRFKIHKTRFNGKDFPRCNLQLYKYMREHGEFTDYKMDIICYYPCNSKREALECEQYYIDLLKPKLNSTNAYTSNEDAIIRNKKNKKIYYDNHKEKLLNYHKNYYKNNKEVYAEKGKIYKDKNKEAISLRRKKCVYCDVCGDFINKDHIARHKRSIKCQSFNS